MILGQSYEKFTMRLLLIREINYLYLNGIGLKSAFRAHKWHYT